MNSEQQKMYGLLALRTVLVTTRVTFRVTLEKSHFSLQINSHIKEKL